MNMKTLENLEERYCRELDRIEDETKQKGVTIESLKTVQLLTDTIKNIKKICMLQDGCADDYSHGGRWEAQMNGMYGRDGSYGHMGSRYHDGRYNNGGYSNNGYSHGDAKSEMLHHLENMMDSTDSDKSREIIRRCMNDLRNS